MGQNLAKYIFFHICIYRQMKTKSKRPADFTLLRGCHDDVRQEGERGLKVIAGLKCKKKHENACRDRFSVSDRDDVTS